MSIRFVIEIAKKNSKYIDRQIEISDTRIEIMRGIFGVGEDDPFMYNSYKINRKINNRIRDELGISLNIDNFECYAGYRG